MPKRYISNKDFILREETDDWAILFCPKNRKTFFLNPISTAIWKFLDGNKTIEDLTDQIVSEFSHTPVDVNEDIIVFVNKLVQLGLVEEL